MVPVEAMLCGTPVIALDKAGARETSMPGVTGVTFPEQTPESLQEAIEEFVKLKLDPVKIRKHAMQFTKTAFQATLEKTILAQYERFTEK